MRLYRVWRNEGTGWDEAAAFVIRAKDAKEARQIAADNCGDEGEAT